MKVFLKHVTRNIMEKKGRSILIIVSLIIASCTLILNLTIPSQIIEANKNKMRNLIGTSDLVIMKYDYFDIDDIKKSDEKINYVGVNQESIIHKDKTLTIYGTSENEASKQKLMQDISLKDNEIVINKDVANKFNYKVNDIMKIDVDGKSYNLKIVDVRESKGLLFLKTYSAIVNENTFNNIFETSSDKYMSYYIDVLDDTKVSEYNDYLNNNNKEFMSQKLVDEEEIKNDNSYVSLILMIIFVMATIMIFFVVSTLNKMIITERTPVIATFRSIGATKKKMNGILILENAMYGLIGGIIGCLISLLINSFCTKLLLGGESLETSVPFGNLIIGVIFAIILEIIMSIGAIIKSNKYSIKNLMFEKVSSKYELHKKEIIFSSLCIITSMLLYFFTSDNNVLLDLLKMTLFWIGVANIIPLIMNIVSNALNSIAKKFNKSSLFISSKNVGSNKMIISSSRLVVIAISVMLVILNVSSSFDKMLDSFSYQFSGYDIFIRQTSKTGDEYEKMLDIKGVDDIDLVYLASPESAKNYDKKLSTPPLVLGMNKSRPDIEEYNYKIKDLKIDEALVDEVYLNDNNWKIGDKIKLKLDGFEGEHEFKIVGTINSFYQSVQREVIVISEEYFKENISKIPFQVTLALDDNVDTSSMIDKLEKVLKDPDIVIMTVDDFVKDQRNNIHTIMYLFYVIIGLALVLSLVGIINNQIISFMERVRELAVLNSVCMSRGQLKKMLFVENLISSITACLFGFIVSIMSVKLINSVLNGIKMYINVKYDFSIALIFIGLVFFILFLTIIIPINKLKKINVVETIKYE